MNLIVAVSGTEVAEGIHDFIQTIGKEGAFAIGTLLGCVISAAMYWLTSRDNRTRQALDLEREKELFGQLKIKDDRINKLHEEIGKLQSELGKLKGKK